MDQTMYTHKVLALMLIIQIALGIVLAVVILKFWRETLVLAILAIATSIVLGAIAGGGYVIYENIDLLNRNIETIFSVVLFLAALVSACWILVKIDQFLSPITERRWRINSKELFQIVISILLVLSGISCLILALLTPIERDSNLIIGLFLLLGGAIAGVSTYTDYKIKTRGTADSMKRLKKQSITD